MKRFILLFVVVALSCTTHPTGPSQSAHPFPQTFRQLSISYRNIPEKWESASDSWYYDQTTQKKIDDPQSGSGTSLYSGVLNFTFSVSSFTQSGDTIKAPGLTLVIDQVGGMLDQIRYSYGGNADPVFSYYSMDCRQIPYVQDTANQIVGKLTGQSLQSGLMVFDTGWSGSENFELHGQSSSYSQTYSDSVQAISSITFRFIP
jgi:hypothetical protein